MFKPRAMFKRFAIAGAALGSLLLVGAVFAQTGQPTGGNGVAQGLVRGLMTRWMPIDQYPTLPDINPRGDLLIGQSLPERTEIVRMGGSWVVQDTTAVATVTAVPTTTAQNTFWNGEPDSGRTYVIDRAWCLIGVTAAAATGESLLGMVNKGPVAAPTAVSLTVSTLNGRNYAGKMVVARSATVTDDKWWVLPSPDNAAIITATGQDVGKTIHAELNGLIQLPPRHQFSLAVMGTNTTATSKCGIQWHEIQMPVAY
jgi:hypothetical protein